MLRFALLALLLALAVMGWLVTPWVRLRFGNVDFQELNGADRVALSRWRHGWSARAACRAASLSCPPQEIFLRAFKRERLLELWGRDDGAAPFVLLRSYPMLAGSGGPGPKRREGDRQVPEGFYEIDRFNPESSFHLSLGLNYPNASDRRRSDPARPGSDIFIHGSDCSIGCLPIGDEAIEELFILASDVHRKNVAPIAVQIFPGKMRGAEWEAEATRHPELQAFWAELQPGFDFFENTRRLPEVRVSDEGRYEAGAPASEMSAR